jgi:hypothetical protein
MKDMAGIWAILAVVTVAAALSFIAGTRVIDRYLPASPVMVEVCFPKGAPYLNSRP